MSKTTKKRYVTKQMEMVLVMPEENDVIAKVIASRGNCLLEVTDENGETYLASMPVKFRNTVWVKRGNFVILEPIEEGNKVRAEIKHVVDNENILYIRQQGSWPKAFNNEAELMTRHAKRGNVAESSGIDVDMLPSSESSDDDEDEEAIDDESDVENNGEENNNSNLFTAS